MVQACVEDGGWNSLKKYTERGLMGSEKGMDVREVGVKRDFRVKSIEFSGVKGELGIRVSRK